MENKTGYKYQKPNRSKDFIPPNLSKKDEYVPKSHIGMYSLLRNPKNESIYMGEDACQNIRMKTFQSVLRIFHKYGSPDYSELWNYNISAINDAGFNYFTVNSNIAPIADLIECFEQEYKISNGNKRLMISFGINKEILVQYLKDVKQSKETGEKVIIPKLKKPGNKTRAEVIFGYGTIKVGIGNEVKIGRNAIFNRFQHWCSLNGISERDGILTALQNVMDDYPIEGLYDTEYYHVVTELDRMIFKSTEEKESFDIELSSVIFNQTNEIIQRYNSDPNNLEKGEMTFDTYISNALYLLNSKIPLKYRDPKLQQDIYDVSEMEKDAGGL